MSGEILRNSYDIDKLTPDNCSWNMILSIITINRNNASGLEKTMQSVLFQNRDDFEYVVVDGASTDDSKEVIQRFAEGFGVRLKWVSEQDKGIYNAMNKGIGMASGAYLQFLNSGDSLVSDDVVEKMYDALERNGNPPILYGNLIKLSPRGKAFRDCCFAGNEITFLGFYRGSLNHPSSYIRKDLFVKYGLYDENLRIVSDWKWFLQVVILGNEMPVYTDCDVTLFDLTGISETNKELDRAERKMVLSELVPPAVLSDYEKWSFPIEQMERLNRHPWAYKIVCFLERCLFKSEKHRMKRFAVIPTK